MLEEVLELAKPLSQEQQVSQPLICDADLVLVKNTSSPEKVIVKVSDFTLIQSK